MRDIRLHHIHHPGLKVRSEVVPRIQPFPKCDRHTAVLELLELGDVRGEERFLDKERSMRRQELDQLLGHGSMDTTVKVKADIEADSLGELESFHGGVEDFGTVEPAHVFGRVHLQPGLALTW